MAILGNYRVNYDSGTSIKDKSKVCDPNEKYFYSISYFSQRIHMLAKVFFLETRPSGQ